MKKAKALLIVGVILALGPIWGVLGTVLGMTKAFADLAEKTGEAKAEALASDISVALWSTIVGGAICPIGVVFLVISILWISKIRRAEKIEQELSGAG